MKKKFIILSVLSLFVSLPVFAKRHFYQKLCNYTQQKLFITTSDQVNTHTRGLKNATIKPNQCPTFRYVVASPNGWDNPTFKESIRAAPSLIHITQFKILHAVNNHVHFSYSYLPTNGYLLGLSRHHYKHYTIYVCDPATAKHCT